MCVRLSVGFCSSSGARESAVIPAKQTTDNARTMATRRITILRQHDSHFFRAAPLLFCQNREYMPARLGSCAREIAVLAGHFLDRGITPRHGFRNNRFSLGFVCK